MPSPLLFARADAPKGGVRDVSPLVVVLHLPELTVVDLREAEELRGASGRIPGARCVPLGALCAASEGWDRDEPLLLVCRSGARSALGARALGREGFSTLFNLAGGMLAWDTNALPCAREPVDPAQSLWATLALATVAACDGDVERGQETLHELLGGEAPGLSVARLGAAVAAVEARLSALQDPRRGYAELLRAGLMSLGVGPCGAP